jgi:hypothetical protein
VRGSTRRRRAPGRLPARAAGESGGRGGRRDDHIDVRPHEGDHLDHDGARGVPHHDVGHQRHVDDGARVFDDNRRPRTDDRAAPSSPAEQTARRVVDDDIGSSRHHDPTVDDDDRECVTDDLNGRTASR